VRPDYSKHSFSHAQHPLVPNDPISVAFNRLGPWFTQFKVNGKYYGGTNAYEGDPRVPDFLEWVKPKGSVLELGSFEGGQSRLIAQDPQVSSLLGLEGRDYLVERATFVKHLFGDEKISFKQCDLEIEGLRKFGWFDAVFCSGLLYHLSRPWKLIEQVSRVTNDFFLSTHYVAEGKDCLRGYWGRLTSEFGYEEPLSGLNNAGFWLTPDSITMALERSGFSIVRERDFPNWRNGPLMNLYCRKTAPRTHRRSDKRQSSMQGSK
jgi:SAM-dependent methyltransferase